MVRALPDKQCLSDPLPTWTLRASVDNLALLLVTRARCCSVEDEDCAHNAGTKEDWFGPGRCSHIGRSPTCLYCPSCLKDWLLNSLWRNWETTVFYRTANQRTYDITPLDGNGSAQSTGWHLAGSRRWQPGGFDTVGSVGSFWQCRHFAPAAAEVIRSWWRITWLV